MSSTSENETEILLGNKHLLAIFFVLAVLLGIAFTGGYMVGRGGTDKKPAVLSAGATDPTASTTTTGMETHALTPSGDGSDNSAPANEQTHTVQPPPPQPVDVVSVPVKDEAPLGSPKKEKPVEDAPPAAKPASDLKPETSSRTKDRTLVPQSGQTFLQVAAVGHTEANALADVLSRKGFHAHAVAKPGANDVYRVLIGPLKDTSDLSNTRDSLRNAGFTKIFVQKY